jgi:hypothetical protein
VRRRINLDVDAPVAISSDPAWLRGLNAIRSIETARVHHADRRRGSSLPLAARAQQPAMPMLGVLGSASTQFRDALAEGLKETGFIEGRNLRIESPTRRKGAIIPGE